MSLSNLECERYLLSILIDSSASRERLLTSLERMDFTANPNQRLFGCVTSLCADGLPVDLMSVADRLTKAGELAAVGGMSYLASLSEGIPVISNPDSYLRIVKNYRSLRDIRGIGREIERRAVEQLDDPQDIVRESIVNLEKAQQQFGNLDAVPSIENLMDRIPGGPLKILTQEASQAAIKTGLTDLDYMINGLEPSTMAVLGGRTSSGKSAMMLSMARNIADNGVPIGIFSIEMTSRNLMERLISMYSHVNLLKFRSGMAEEFEIPLLQRAAGEVYALPIYIDDTPGLSFSDLAARSEKLVREKGCRVIFVDYVQRMIGAARRRGNGRENTHTILTEIVESIKTLSMKLQVSFVVLAQLSRETERRRGGDNRPQLSDLKESGSLEECADLVAFIYRESIYKPEREDLKGTAEIIVAKARNAGIGSVKVRFKEGCVTFEDL